MDLPDGTSEATIKEMCEKLLANPVIEDYEIAI
jgi:phosphoribosylformylglycinamidine synthase